MGTQGGVGGQQRGQQRGRVDRVHEGCVVFYRRISRIQPRSLEVWRKITRSLFYQAQNLHRLENNSGPCVKDYLLYLDVIKFI